MTAAIKSFILSNKIYAEDICGTSEVLADDHRTDFFVTVLVGYYLIFYMLGTIY